MNDGALRAVKKLYVRLSAARDNPSEDPLTNVKGTLKAFNFINFPLPPHLQLQKLGSAEPRGREMWRPAVPRC
jgi:hypothetical protein